MGKVFHESDVVRNTQGEFADKPGGGKGAGGNTSFLAKFSKKIGATDDAATAKAKLAESAKSWNPGAPKKAGAFDAIKVAKKAAPSTPQPPPAKTGNGAGNAAILAKLAAKVEAKKAAAVKVAGPPTLPKKKAPAPAEITEAGDYLSLSAVQAAAMQKQMLKGKPWAPEERSALRTYTGEAYTRINGGLRKGTKSVTTLKTIENARKGMRETPQGITVHRGMGSGSAFGFPKGRAITNEMLDGLVGRTWSDPGFTSTATRDGGYGYGQRIRAVIAVPAGTRGAFVEGVTQNKGEDEFVLDAGTHFKISRVERRAGGKVTLYMEVVKQDA